MIRKKTTFLVPPFPFVKRDKIRTRSRRQPTSLNSFWNREPTVTLQHQPKHSRSKVLQRDCCIMDWIPSKNFQTLEAKRHNCNAWQDIEYYKHSTRNSLTVFGKKIQELTTSTNEGEIKFIEITDETVTASLNADAHMVFSKERFMTNSEVIEANEPKRSFKNNNSTQN
jgi:hypothetical protein